MADIKLTWVTPPAHLADVTEGQTVGLLLEVTERVIQVGYVGQDFVPLGDDVDRAVKVEIDGIDTPFLVEANDKTVYWDAALAPTQPVPVVVTLRGSAVFSLLNGTLPPGLSLSDGGEIKGIVANITTAPILSRFTVRARTPTHAVDRTFTMTATGVDYPATFNPAQLLPTTVEPVYRFTYRDLGTVSVSQGFAFAFDVRDPDGVFPRLSVRKVTGFAPGEGKYGGLPEGLEMDGLTLQGAVGPGACPGRYFFDVVIDDPTAPSSARFAITVPERIADRIGVIPRVDWITPEGSLGTIEETEPCYFSVKASSVEAPEVVYGLSPTSSPLPDGITLNPTTGRLYGSFPFVDSTTVFTFTLRASAGDLFKDRVFSITVKDWFDLKSVHTLRLRVRVLDDQLLVPFYKRMIPAKNVFRAEDQNFGIITHPYVYMLKGLDGSIDVTEAFKGQNVATITNKDYEASFRLVLGEHKFALARDSSGKVIYEVLYRDLYDPMAKAGGFTLDAHNQPIRQNVLWPQSAGEPRFIMPNSITNMRTDMIMDIGLAMADPIQRTLLGANTHELMPLWMRSLQINGMAPGFRAALVLAYLAPGSMADVQKSIKSNLGAAVPNGHVYHFDHYYTTVSQNIGSTDTAVHLE